MKSTFRKLMSAICLLAVCLTAGEALGETYTGRDRPAGNSAAYTAVKPAAPYVCRTQEEIAWDLMMYGIQNIQPLRARIKDYDDLLAAYRRALKTVRGQDQ